MEKKLESVVLGIICFALTIAICIQIKTVSSNGSTVSINSKENELRDQVLRMKEKYEVSYERLQILESQLEKTRTDVSSNSEELKSLEEKIKKANILLGQTDVTGQGVSIVVADAPSTIKALEPSDLIVHNTDLLSIVNELKNAGAEAIEINGQRIVNSSAITCEGNVIMINGERVSSPFQINAIGYPELLSTLNRAGGILTNLQLYNIKTELKKVDNLTILKYTGIRNFKFATVEE